MKNEIHKEVATLQNYVVANRWYILFMYLILFIVWFPWLSGAHLHIDSEVVINHPRQTPGWLTSGRWGAMLTKKIFNLIWFNPYFEVIMGFVVFGVALILLSFLFWRISDIKGVTTLFVGIIIYCNPIMVEQVYFFFQIFEIAWAYILCIIATGYSYIGILYKSKINFFISIICLIWAISTYQIFAVLYITLIVSCFSLLYRKNEIYGEHKIETIIYWKIVWQSILILLTALLMNKLIIELFFPQNGYLTGMIQWGILPFKQCMENIIGHIFKGFTGINSVFFTPFFSLLALGVFATVVSEVAIDKKHNFSWLYILAAVGLQVTPFLLTCVLGSAPTIRAQIIYPVALAFDLIFLLSRVTKKSQVKIFWAVLTALLVWGQIQAVERLIYTDEIRIQEDVRLATELEQRIHDIGAEGKPIAFIGIPDQKSNQACMSGDMVGISAFGFTSEVLPHYYHSGSRGCAVMETLGFSFQNVEERELLDARNLALNFPSWPAKDSVIDIGEYVIVKWSEDQWPEEVMEGSIKRMDENSIVVENNIKFGIDLLKDDGILYLNGWVIEDGIDSMKVLPVVCLKDKSGNYWYNIETVRVQRLDLKQVFENGDLYEYGGYVAKGKTSFMEKNLDEYDLYVGIKKENKFYLKKSDKVFAEN